MLEEGQLIDGRFRLVRPVGSGGMAHVWWARHELLDRDVAIKFLPGSRDEQHALRFEREARCVGKFRHRNIVEVLDAGKLPDGSYLFLVMELLRGMSFADRLEPGRPLSPEEVLPVLIEVCRGLEASHAAGIVHRDVKPENIFLAVVPGEGVVPKIVDFGISHVRHAEDGRASAITLEGQVLGTPAYMSPEQALGTRDIGPAADLWAVGVILYEALAGRQPFAAERPFAVLRQIVDDDPPPLAPWIDGELRDLVLRCLRKDPAERPASAAALRADLERALAAALERDRFGAPGARAEQAPSPARGGRTVTRPWMPLAPPAPLTPPAPTAPLSFRVPERVPAPSPPPAAGFGARLASDRRARLALAAIPVALLSAALTAGGGGSAPPAERWVHDLTVARSAASAEALGESSLAACAAAGSPLDATGEAGGLGEGEEDVAAEPEGSAASRATRGFSRSPRAAASRVRSPGF